MRIAAQVADALGAAHERGVVHRDIKPANVMLLPGDHVTVMDFGIARHADQVTELTGSAAIGTPAFMAPEQFDGGEVGAAAELYAVGVLLFALLTGRMPRAALSQWRAHYERLSLSVVDAAERKFLRKHRPDTLYEHDEIFEIGSVWLTAYDVPSQYQGSAWLYCKGLGLLFTGLTLHALDPRHRGLYGGMLSAMRPATRVLPGWGEETTAGALLHSV
ncbi:serine/threonine protein kinase [Actinomadura algeriensis]|uniref:non-specific serine/threonine protein kinase n=1 Tax=Actinomadura algeriensis TaxID=1679523 RepID=A0ABR9JSY6_9ACTN|nr:serine/threonine protein kinase [Actinomadura algeriensis]